MITMHRSFTVLALGASVCLLGAPLYAQTQRSGGGEAQKFMQQYQQMAAEKTALQAQVAQMKKDLDAANAELASVKKERDAAKTHVGISAAALTQATGAKETAERSLEQSKQRMTELIGRYRDTAANLKDAEAEGAKLRKDLTEKSSAFDKCALSNAELYDINRDILDRYEHVGMFTRVSADEPFTKITRTRMENLADEYRQRADALRVKKAGP